MTCRKEDLDRVFKSYGNVGDYYIPRNRNSTGNRGFGFVRYYSEEDAKKALAEDGNTINGRQITVKLADARPPRREYSFFIIFIKYRRRRYASRSRSYEYRRRRYSRSYSRGRSHRRHHDHHSHHRHHSYRDRSNSYDRKDDARTQNKSNSRSRSRSRSLSQDNKMAE